MAKIFNNIQMMSIINALQYKQVKSGTEQVIRYNDVKATTCLTKLSHSLCPFHTIHHNTGWSPWHLDTSSFPCHSGVWLDTALPDDPPDCLTPIYNSVFEHRGLKKHRGQTSSVVCNFESNASKSFNFAFTCWKKKNIQRCRSRFINVFLKNWRESVSWNLCCM